MSDETYKSNPLPLRTAERGATCTVVAPVRHMRAENFRSAFARKAKPSADAEGFLKEVTEQTLTCSVRVSF